MHSHRSAPTTITPFGLLLLAVMPLAAVASPKGATLADLAAVRALTASGAARSIRLAADVSLYEIAAAVPCSPSTVLRWERNERRPHGAKGIAYGVILRRLMESGRVR